MATKIPIDAINYATDYIKYMPLWRVQLQVLQDASDHLWYAAPWRWTTGNLPTTTLVNAQQDYTVTLPADFEYAIEAHLVNSTDRSTARELEIVSGIPAITALSQSGQPNQIDISGVTVTGKYRFEPVPRGYNANSPLPIVQGTYKKTAPVLDDTNIYIAGSLLFPDQYFRVFKIGVLHYSYLYADDQRAGNTTFQGNSIAYNGMLASFESAIQTMRAIEKLPLADLKTVPNPKMDKG